YAADGPGGAGEDTHLAGAKAEYLCSNANGYSFKCDWPTPNGVINLSAVVRECNLRRCSADAVSRILGSVVFRVDGKQVFDVAGCLAAGTDAGTVTSEYRARFLSKQNVLNRFGQRHRSQDILEGRRVGSQFVIFLLGHELIDDFLVRHLRRYVQPYGPFDVNGAIAGHEHGAALGHELLNRSDHLWLHVIKRSQDQHLVIRTQTA